MGGYKERYLFGCATRDKYFIKKRKTRDKYYFIKK